MQTTTPSLSDSNIIRAVKQGQKTLIAEFAHDRLFWLTVALLILLLVLIVLYPLRTAGDITLHLHNGGRILEGQRLYVDFFNFNTPTIDYLNVPPVAISRLTGLHPILVYQIFIWLALTGTALGSGLLMVSARRGGRLGELSPWLIPMAIVLSSHIAWMLITYGQRDHIFILALLIWATLRWYRWEGGHPLPWAALIIGAFAASGASLKPTFALAFVLVEGYGLVRYRRWQTLFTWEIFGAVIILGLYGAYFLMQPDILQIYLTQVAPTVSAGYKGYGYRSAVDLIFRELQSLIVMSFAALLVYLGIRRRSPSGNLFILLATLCLGTLLSFALQTKGWRYHALPMVTMIFITGALLVDLAVALPRMRLALRRLPVFKQYPIFILVLCVLMNVLLVLIFPEGESSGVEQQLFLDYSSAGDSVIIADTDVIPIYPAIMQMNRIPVARYPISYPLVFAYGHLEALPDDVYAPGHVPPPIAQSYLDILIVDVTTQRPELILLRYEQNSAGPHFMNVARYIKAHTDIEALLDQAYEWQGDVSGYEVYTRKDGT